MSECTYLMFKDERIELMHEKGDHDEEGHVLNPCELQQRGQWRRISTQTRHSNSNSNPEQRLVTLHPPTASIGNSEKHNLQNRLLWDANDQRRIHETVDGRDRIRTLGDILQRRLEHRRDYAQRTTRSFLVSK